MQCVILAAGEGTRMRPLTLETPKPLVKVAEKAILDHIIDALPEEITELVLVVGYKQEQIRAHCGEVYKGRPVQYVVQENPKAGTGDALFCARDILKEKFLMMYGDDIHGAPALKEAIMHNHSIFGAHSETPEKFGVLEMNEDNTLKGIVEKPKQPPSHLVNIGGAVLTPVIFEYEPPLSAAGEYYLTDSITDYAKDYPVEVLQQDLWIPVGSPEDIEAAENILSELQNT